MSPAKSAMGDTLWGIRCVWLRYFAVFRKNLVYGVMTTFIEPLLYLLSFGFGLGAMVGPLTVDGQPLTYRQFILAGIAGQTVLFQGFFDAAYGAFVRMYYQRIFKAMATTPITLSEVLWGELLWDATKATFSASAVLAIGVAIGDFRAGGALLSVPLLFLFSLLFAGMGLWVSATAKTIEQISYPQYLIVFPMFLFCGVYFPVDNLPAVVQTLTWCLPLTPVLAIVRSLLLGLPLPPQALPLVLIWTVVLVAGSRRAMLHRLVK